MIHVTVWLSHSPVAAWALLQVPHLGWSLVTSFMSHIVSTMRSHGCSYRYKFSDCFASGEVYYADPGGLGAALAVRTRDAKERSCVDFHAEVTH